MTRPVAMLPAMQSMLQFRLTKYDPALRDPDGAYRRADWTSIDDIGRIFAGHKLTCGEYDRVEHAYVRSALAFMREAGVRTLRVEGLERHDPRKPAPLTEGETLPLDRAGTAIAGALREEYWCRFESDRGYVHVGYDFYLYLGVLVPCPGAMTLTRDLGLFVEPFATPHAGSSGDAAGSAPA